MLVFLFVDFFHSLWVNKNILFLFRRESVLVTLKLHSFLDFADTSLKFAQAFLVWHHKERPQRWLMMLPCTGVYKRKNSVAFDQKIYQKLIKFPRSPSIHRVIRQRYFDIFTKCFHNLGFLLSKHWYVFHYRCGISTSLWCTIMDTD